MKTGGQAFPSPAPLHPQFDYGGAPLHPQFDYGGMTLRDYFAAHAPVDFSTAQRIFGGEIEGDDIGRAAFMAVWTMLRYEYADAMIAAREDKK